MLVDTAMGTQFTVLLLDRCRILHQLDICHTPPTPQMIPCLRLLQVASAVEPDLVIFVMDSSIGQAAQEQAQAFRESVQVWPARRCSQNQSLKTYRCSVNAATPGLFALHSCCVDAAGLDCTSAHSRRPTGLQDLDTPSSSPQIVTHVCSTRLGCGRHQVACASSGVTVLGPREARAFQLLNLCSAGCCSLSPCRWGR